jgi:hypothetical protein
MAVHRDNSARAERDHTHPQSALEPISAVRSREQSSTAFWPLLSEGGSQALATIVLAPTNSNRVASACRDRVILFMDKLLSELNSCAPLTMSTFV